MLRSAVYFRRCYQTRSKVFGFHLKDKKSFDLPKEVKENRALNSNLFRLITAYRDTGHLISNISPVSYEPKPYVPELELTQYALNSEAEVRTSGLINGSPKETSIENIIRFLEEAYCGRLTAELGFLPLEKKEWMAAELEAAAVENIGDERRRKMCKIVIESEIFDFFLGMKFPTLKRYGLEGAEGMLPFMEELLNQLNSSKALVVGMTHRGRLNLLTGLFKVPPSLVFHKIRGGAEIAVESRMWSADVLSHLICSQVIGSSHVSILPNPSHLELVNPVSMGNARAKQLRKSFAGYNDGIQNDTQIVNLQVHGDAAFAGQGVNQEMLAFSKLPHFSVNGTIHLVVNNQLGFTTPGSRGRSSLYSSDLAKTISAPIIQVNGDDPESLAKAAKIAVKYRNEFEEDIFVEMHCYRRRGHNELDDPTFTNPELYAVIKNRPTLSKLYAEKLIEENILTADEVHDWKESYSSFLNDEFKTEVHPPVSHLQNQWKAMVHPGKDLTTWDTGIDTDTLRYIGLRSVSFPETFSIHPHLLKTHVQSRKDLVGNPQTSSLNWSTAEALAFGSLLLQGFNVRISGQDVGRGTFSHRHVMLVDQKDGDTYIPLNDCGENFPGRLEVANSILSEEAVLAYEYGMSIESPNNLVIWEAQFGDFVNGAQNVIDTYISSGEAKWARSTSLTMLLPHGYDGAGPEHSSCRIERLLQLSNSSEEQSDGDDVNLQVAWPSTPAQYFHLLRRQQIRNFRSPLVVVSPKTLLRLQAATSSFADLKPGTHFRNIIPEVNPLAQTVVFTSGKHYYNLVESKPRDAAVVRLESIIPFPTRELQDLIDTFPHATSFVWSQEEPRNMGAWTYVKPRFENLVGIKLKYAGLPPLAAPAYGLPHLHKNSQQKVISDTFS